MAARRPCIFCNRTDSPLTREDIFAEWIGGQFPDPNWTAFVTRGTTALKAFKSKNKPGLISRKVCKQCNNVWMSGLESAAKTIMVPLMNGIKTTLSTADQTVLTQWFVKTMMVYEVNAKRVYGSYFSLAERVALAGSLTIPIDTMVFLARYKASDKRHIIVYEQTPEMLRNEDKTLPETYGYSPTVTIKQLALQIFSFRRTEEFDKRFGGFEIPNWRQASIQIWPIIESGIVWPPPTALDEITLDLFAQRWGDIAPFLR